MRGRSLLLLFSFLIGYELCLPVFPEDSGISVPFVFTHMLLVGGLSLKEGVLVFHALLNVRLLTQVFPTKRFPPLLGIYWLFIVGGLVSIAINMAPRDLPELGRFMASAYYIFAVRAYIRRDGVERLIVALLLGLVASIAVNFAYTFLMPRAFLGFLPMLWGQNGPGGFAGAFVALSFILYGYLQRKFARSLLLVAVVLSGFLVLMSYSKLGMIMALIGLLVWVSSLTAGRRNLVVRYVSLAGTVAVLTIGFARFAPENWKEQLEVIYEYKFYNAGEGAFDESDMSRWGYFIGVGEIFMANPLGVSYTGIGAGLLETEIHQSGGLPEEGSVQEANPHNSFLYYIAANGVIGWLATTLFFVYFLKLTYRVLHPRTGNGLYYTGLVAAVLLLFANTLPSFFNAFFFESILLYMVYAGRQTGGDPVPSPIEARVPA